MVARLCVVAFIAFTSLIVVGHGIALAADDYSNPKSDNSYSTPDAEEQPAAPDDSGAPPPADDSGGGALRRWRPRRRRAAPAGRGGLRRLCHVPPPPPVGGGNAPNGKGPGLTWPLAPPISRQTLYSSETSREAHLSTIAARPQAAPRLPRAHGDRGRPQGAGTAQGQGTQASVGLIGRERESPPPR